VSGDRLEHRHRLGTLERHDLANCVEEFQQPLGVAKRHAPSRDQFRNRSGLESAIGRPATHAHYEGADLATQAALLAHGIAENQSFLDGNKRLAIIPMPTFLDVNGYIVPVSDRELAGSSVSVPRRRRKTWRIASAA
jgi:prophage maintenance system killer protein